MAFWQGVLIGLVVGIAASVWYVERDLGELRVLILACEQSVAEYLEFLDEEQRDEAIEYLEREGGHDRYADP